ncbi:MULTISPECIES: hypothetical protein [Rhizobium]|uniref:Conserved protein n=1 Tax=Rhizobium favelukesii TaxID=348824 RepID=W6RBC6_9HYPH|nr:MULTISPECIES: hypothetical protein [Rhizobium]MCS0460342.1 hypothetical protein [Rhizobium favelukesii]UFS80854.1 hypothetical protein LPB79_21115 [Rhizobium sp. T136]CDM57625.1 putative conserved protein [Rhizobium favelukesii]
MIYQRPAFEEVTIAHGGDTVTLRPSLRAAATLEARFGFAALFRALDEGNFTIISEIILTASIKRQDAAAFLGGNFRRPLSSLFPAVVGPLAEFVSMLQPATDPKAKTTNPGKAVAWAEFYRDLYEKATGWLGWTPETTWNATPTEIDRAYSGYIAKLKAIHGSAEQDKPAHDPREEVSDEEARNGLSKLKANAKRGKL